MAFAVELNSEQDLDDVRAFVDRIDEPALALGDLFRRDADIFISRAPGRLDVMGGIADYSGSLVLEMPIRQAAIAAAQKSDDGLVKIVSIGQNNGRHLRFEADLATLADLGSEGYAAARTWFGAADERSWAAYAAGAFIVLQKELGASFGRGCRILIGSDVPIGKGVSSSAAIEVSTMRSICSAFDIEIGGRELAMLCQTVENQIVGAACGVMDQMASSCGRAGRLFAMTCQPAEIEPVVSLPDDLTVWGIDSGVRHSIAGSDYASVRAGTFIGYRITCELAGLKAGPAGDGIVSVTDHKWNGYPSNITINEYQNYFAASIPVSINGGEFISKYQGTTDRVVAIEPDRDYMVRAPFEHAIYENDRVRRFAEILRNEETERDRRVLGELMFASHRSYTACGLNEPGTDCLVEMARKNLDRGIYGARITGGGSGGTVVFLGDRNAARIISEIAEEYQDSTRRPATVFEGSSPGADQFGTVTLRPI